MYGMAVFKLLGSQIFQHFIGPFRLTVCLGQHVLGAVPEPDSPHARGIGADGTGIPGGLHALQRIPDIDFPLGIGIRDLALIS